MSKTKKDVPYRVIEQKMLQKGVQDHRHDLLGQHSEGFRKSRELSKSFDKSESKAIYAYREYLKGLEGITFEEVESGGTSRYTNIATEDGCFHWEREYTPKTISFEVSEPYSFRYTAYCTDAAHYDRETNTDTRDGGRVVCDPEWAKYNGDMFSKSGGCRCCEPVSRVTQKTKLKSRSVSAAKSFNSGMSIEELDELYEDII